MDFDLYASAPLPPKPKADWAPNVLDLCWTRLADGTFTAPPTKAFIEFWTMFTVKELNAVGISRTKDRFRMVTFDPKVASAGRVVEVVAELRAERRARRAAERKASRQKGLL